jgi:hypothetical protein
MRTNAESRANFYLLIALYLPYQNNTAFELTMKPTKQFSDSALWYLQILTPEMRDDLTALKISPVFINYFINCPKAFFFAFLIAYVKEFGALQYI